MCSKSINLGLFPTSVIPTLLPTCPGILFWVGTYRELLSSASRSPLLMPLPGHLEHLGVCWFADLGVCWFAQGQGRKLHGGHTSARSPGDLFATWQKRLQILWGAGTLSQKTRPHHQRDGLWAG